jgi:hypothetical protein
MVVVVVAFAIIVFVDVVVTNFHVHISRDEER